MKWMSPWVSLLLLAVCASAPAREGAVELFAAPPEAPPFTPGHVVLTAPEIDALILPRSGASSHFPSIDRFVGTESAPLEFRQVALFADGARIVEVGGGIAREKQRPARHYYLASNRSAGIGLTVDPVSGAVSGFASKGGERLAIGGDFVSGLQFEAIVESDDGANSCGNGEHDLALGAPQVGRFPGAQRQRQPGRRGDFLPGGGGHRHGLGMARRLR
jgi:hypothetical protein